MAQIKKVEIKQAILDTAYKLFSKRGYSATNITDIARSAGVAPANVYVYFRSKLEILFSVYEPWLIKQVDDLERSLLHIRNPRQRLRKILVAIWRDIPSADNGFANNMMQAIATTSVREGYSPRLRLAIEERVARLLDGCPHGLDHVNSRALANILLMAFDGYALNFHLKGGAVCPSRQITFFADILLNSSGIERNRGPMKRSRLLADRMGPNGKARIAG
ncbi:MAG TPA: TetR/AcrR family transcriptional regulator [Burkholderiaceae bacterium]|nr:TetR/AcrR family transcriptional regulator [Burkholderiaceae bacterium]